MTREVVEKLRAKAHEYELNAARAQEVGDKDGETFFLAIEVAFREFANVIDEALEEAA